MTGAKNMTRKASEPRRSGSAKQGILIKGSRLAASRIIFRARSVRLFFRQTVWEEVGRGHIYTFSLYAQIGERLMRSLT